MTEDLGVRWREYLRCCNERRLDDLPQHLHETITCNGEPLAIADYVNMIAGSIAAVPDFRWEVQELLASTDKVAVRLRDTGTPCVPWLGLEPSGRSFDTQEMALYHFREGRIEDMWFLFDIDTVRNQVRG